MKWKQLLKKYQVFLAILFIIASVVCIVFHLNNNLYKYSERYDEKKYEKRYLESQWRVPNSKKPISDADLYSYSGYQYIKGENPILINPEQPPLGKFFIGIFIIIFNNAAISSLFFALALLFLVYAIVYEATGSLFFGTLALFMVTTHTLFIDQLIFPAQLDVMQVVFFLLISLFFVKYKKTKKAKHLLLTGICLGMMIAIKVFLQSFTIMAIFLLIVFYQSKKDKRWFMKQYLSVILISLLVFTLTYWSYFWHGGTLRGFLGVQKWIALFYLDSGIDKVKIFGNYLGLVLFNKWRVWSPGYPFVSYQYWSVTWPMFFLVGMYLAIKTVFDKVINSIELTYFSLWVILYSTSLLVVPVFPRYLLLLFVPLIILCSLYANKIFKSKKII